MNTTQNFHTTDGLGFCLTRKSQTGPVLGFLDGGPMAERIATRI